MARDYKILLAPLHATAEASIKWFQDHWGLTAKSEKIEQAIDPDVHLKPTFSVQTRDHHTLCIEVAASVYPNYLDAFVLSCRDKGLPVKLYVAIQKGIYEEEYAQKLKAAKQSGVGVMEVDDASGTVLHDALSLSLTGVRPIDVRSFPKKHRQSLTDAAHTFRDGNPPKACSMIYDEIEALFRRFAKKAKSKGWWPNKAALRLTTVSWAKLIADVDKHLDRKACGCRALTPAFMARMLGITPFRNDTGHKPTNAKDLKKRDQELRTRFESAVDLFRDFLDATKKLKL